MRLINLIPLQEIDFPSQTAFDTYSKNHKLRPDTKVVVAGRVTTAGRAAQNSPTPVKGTSVFSKDNTKNIFHKQDKPKDLESSVTNHLNKISGGKGYTQKDEGGAIAYNMGNGDTPTYTLYMGKEGNKHRVTLEPTYGNDPKKLQGKIDKSFDKAEDAINYMGDIAKRYRKELEMDDSQNPQTAIKNIADLTDNNDHNGAVMALAKMMNDKSSTAEMEKIQKYHNSKGHMPQSLTKYRSSILNNLLVQAKKKYGDKVAKQLHSSF